MYFVRYHNRSGLLFGTLVGSHVVWSHHNGLTVVSYVSCHGLWSFGFEWTTGISFVAHGNFKSFGIWPRADRSLSMAIKNVNNIMICGLREYGSAPFVSSDS